MAYTQANLRTYLGYSARNASDSAYYSDARRDWAILMALQEWSRLTKTPRVLTSLTLTVGDNTIPSLPTGFTPDKALSAILTISGQIIKPDLEIVTWDSLINAQINAYGDYENYTTPMTSPPTGRPYRIAFKDGSAGAGTAIVDYLPDQAYVIQLWWWKLATVIGDLTDEALLPIATLGAVYYLQHSEPENASSAERSYQQFLNKAKQVSMRNDQGRGAAVIERTSPYQANGAWR